MWIYLLALIPVIIIAFFIIRNLYKKNDNLVERKSEGERKTKTETQMVSRETTREETPKKRSHHKKKLTKPLA